MGRDSEGGKHDTGRGGRVDRREDSKKRVAEGGTSPLILSLPQSQVEAAVAGPEWRWTIVT